MLIFLSCEKFVFAHKVYNNSDHVLVYFFFFLLTALGMQNLGSLTRN